MKLKLLVTSDVVRYTAVFSVVTQRSYPQTQRGGALRDDTKNGCVAGLLAMEPESDSDQPPTHGLSRLCLATFEQLFAVLATSSKFCLSDHEQLQFEQNVALEHISSKKKSTISQKTSIHANFLNVYFFFFQFLKFIKKLKFPAIFLDRCQ